MERIAKFVMFAVLLISSHVCFGEVLEVFSLKYYFPESRMHGYRYYERGALVGVVDTKERTIEEIVLEQAKKDKKRREENPHIAGPFYGPTIGLIVYSKHSGYYYVWFEFEKGHRTFTGWRARFFKISSTDFWNNTFQRNETNFGQDVFDEDLLNQLKSIVLSAYTVEKKP